MYVLEGIWSYNDSSRQLSSLDYDLRILTCLYCMTYTVQCTLYILWRSCQIRSRDSPNVNHWLLTYNVRRTFTIFIQGEIYTVQCTLYSVHYTVYIVHCTPSKAPIYSYDYMECLIVIVQCTMYIIQYNSLYCWSVYSV